MYKSPQDCENDPLINIHWDSNTYFCIFYIEQVYMLSIEKV